MAVAAIYARVSSDKQREENTIASQTGGADRLRAESRLSGAGRVGLRRRRL